MQPSRVGRFGQSDKSIFSVLEAFNRSIYGGTGGVLGDIMTIKMKIVPFGAYRHNASGVVYKLFSE